MSRVNIKTRDNDLIEDEKLHLNFEAYKNSVACSHLENNESDDLPDHFYYIMCTTNNNSQIETESNKHFTEYKEDCKEMSEFLNSLRFKLRMRQIQMILGEKKSVDKKQIADSNADVAVPEFKSYGGEFARNLMKMDPTLSGNAASALKKDMVISGSGIETKSSPNKDGVESIAIPT